MSTPDHAISERAMSIPTIPWDRTCKRCGRRYDLHPTTLAEQLPTGIYVHMQKFLVDERCTMELDPYLAFWAWFHSLPQKRKVEIAMLFEDDLLKGDYNKLKEYFANADLMTLYEKPLFPDMPPEIREAFEKRREAKRQQAVEAQEAARQAEARQKMSTEEKEVEAFIAGMMI